MSRKPLIVWPPPGDKSKQFHTEVAAPAIICRELGLDVQIGPPATKDAKGKAIRPKWSSIDEWLRDDASSGMGGLTLGGARSWNHPQLEMCARGLALGDWGDSARAMAMQAGRIEGEGVAHFLDGEEPRSTDYDPFRWACELVFAAKHPDQETRRDAIRVLQRQMALAALGAVDWTDQGPEYRNARGELWYNGATLSPVGERSPKTSNPDQLGLFERLARNGNGNAREGFAGAVADAVGIRGIMGDRLGLVSGPDHPRRALAMLGNAKVFGSFRFVEYPEGRLVMRPEQKNPNTPSALWSWADHATKRQTRGYPFDPAAKNRGGGAPRSLGCTIEGDEVVARSTDSRFEARFRLPTSTPLWEVVVDEDGARRVS